MATATASANGTAKAPMTATHLSIPAIEIDYHEITIVGDSELITHAWSEKAKREMLEKQMGKARAKKEPKDPVADYEAAFYRLPGGAPAMPTLAFKNAVVSAASQVEGLTKVFLRGTFHVVGELVEVEGTPRMREDMVRIAMGTADLRYRPGFPEWSVKLLVRLNSRALTMEQLIHLFNQAGFSVGVCEWRPEKDGPFGMFHVESTRKVSRAEAEGVR